MGLHARRHELPLREVRQEYTPGRQVAAVLRCCYSREVRVFLRCYYLDLVRHDKREFYLPFGRVSGWWKVFSARVEVSDGVWPKK
jgi:hypothetical protein